LSILRITIDCGRISCHAPNYTMYRVSAQVSTSPVRDSAKHIGYSSLVL
jgi:hypothetical protein